MYDDTLRRPDRHGGLRLALEDTQVLTFTHEELERSLPERFARVAASRPSALAVAVGNKRITYSELAQRSDALAAEIVRRASANDAPVAVLLHDEVSMVTGILSTWKAGKLCVPLDDALPQARLEIILRDSQAGLVITDRVSSASLPPRPGSALRQLRIDELDRLEDDGPARSTVSADTLACILYTSGSTGEPKGVVRTHRSILHRARCSVASLAIRHEDRVSALHSPASAGGLRDVVTALFGGAALLPFDLRHAGFGALARWIDREEISVLCAVVSTLRHVLASLDPQVRFPSLRAVRLGSEPLYRRDVERLLERVRSDCILVTGYGASEASGIAEYRMDPATPLPSGRVPAGYPLEDVEIIVQDQQGRPMDQGHIGEVVVRSRFLSLGYWRRPELTRALFQSDPADRQTRTYRTGDIGRLRSDGCLELLGRRDDQVKVRGYLGHPGEIELALVEHPAIREATVTGSIDVDGETRLVAYVVPQSSPAPSTGLLRRYLQARLPAYMIPAVFVTLETLPLTVTGKVDRGALPPPPRPEAARERPFVAPRSPTEHQIAAIWEKIFGVSPIGANDNFFDLGGDSLMAAALVATIEETFGRVLSPSVLLQASTVADLATSTIRVESGFNEPFTVLRASGTRAPIFFLHNDYGRGLYTHALARCLDADRPFYAVHLDGLDELAALPTVEALAANRIQAVRAARRHGPYVLGGHCHGGLIALEMARQLRADGEHVKLVVMVDTRAPSPGLRALRRASHVLGQLRGPGSTGLAEGFTFLARLCKEIDWRVRYYQGRLEILRRAGIRAQMGFARRKLTESTRGFTGMREERRAWSFHVAAPKAFGPRRAYSRTVRRYVPPRYTGPVALFRAEELPARRPDLGWSSLLPRLEVVVVPGDHHTCITRHVAAFGARLDDVLRHAETAR